MEPFVIMARHEMPDRYGEKLARTGLVEKGALLLGTACEADGGDDPRRSPCPSPASATGRMVSPPPEKAGALAWNRNDPRTLPLERAVARLGRRAVIAARPAEPYRTMLRHLAAAPIRLIQPDDFETRIFLTDLPVLETLTEEELTAALAGRRGAVTRDGTIVATAKRDPDTALVIYSAACFAIFVTFFSDLLRKRRQGELSGEARRTLKAVRDNLGPPVPPPPALASGPFSSPGEIREAIAAAGRLTVQQGLVDANFGNVSYRHGDELFITGRGSPLDALAGRILVVPLPGPSHGDAAASTELPAHRRIVLETPYRAVLHGHPKFSVILSMDCREEGCPGRGNCHRRCLRERLLAGIPVVAGEAGAGPDSLGNTVPPAVRDHGAAVVFGHGVFTAGRRDFHEAFTRLYDLESTCRDIYFRILGD